MYMGKSTYDTQFHSIQRGRLGGEDERERKDALDKVGKAGGGTNERLWWKGEKV
jgi:hypothetical protein